MAIKTFGTKDAYQVMNELFHEATGSDIDIVDLNGFVSAGTTVLESGYENLFNALSVCIGKTIIKADKYKGKLGLIYSMGDTWAERIRKISFYSQDNEYSGMYNTDLVTNLGKGIGAHGSDGSVSDMWEQNPSIPFEQNFYSDYAWDRSHTEYLDQAKKAFTNEADFIAFINGCLIEVDNDITQTIEGLSRMAICNRIGGIADLVGNETLGSECMVNLTTEFNTKYGTSYTTAEILGAHATDFIKFFTARVKIDSERLTNRSKLYHNSYDDADKGSILRFTPVENQRFIYYSPLFTELDKELASVFNPEKLKLPEGEGVTYWQSIVNPSEVKVAPALPDGQTGASVELDYVVGLLFDKDALAVNNKFTGVYNSPIEAKHGYINTFYHYRYGIIDDYSENSILYYMADEDLHPDITQVFSFTGDGTTTEFDASEAESVVPEEIPDGYALVDGSQKVYVDDVDVTDDVTIEAPKFTFTEAPAEGDAIKYTETYQYSEE